MKHKNIVVIGATSAIAQETCKDLCHRSSHFLLVGRNKPHLEIIAKDLTARQCKKVDIHVCDLSDEANHNEILKTSLELMGKIDLVLFAHGSLSDQMRCQTDFTYAKNEFHLNFLTYVSLLELFASELEKNKSGTLAVISSVAGDRGKASNYHYGAAKAALSTFCQGLRNRLYKSNVSVIDIRPGLTETPMTKDIQKSALFSSARKVGVSISKAITSGKELCYAPNFWRYIMFIIRNIPERIFKRMSL